MKLSAPKIFLILIAAGLIINYPYINNHFHYDDFFFVSLLEEKVPYNHWEGFWSWDAKDFEGFRSLWWLDPEMDGRFLRPLFSFVFASAFKIFGRDAALPLHLLSVLLHSIVSFTIFLIFYRLSGNRALSFLAAFLFLVCDDSSMTVGWISTGTDILAVLFMNLSLLFYIIARQDKKNFVFIISYILLAISFLCKETAAIAPAAILLYEFIFTELPEAESQKSGIRKKLKLFLSGWRRWSPVLALWIAYIILYKAGNFGVTSLLYFDPFRQTGEYLFNLLKGYPIMFTGFLSLFPLSMTIFFKGWALPVIIGGIILFVLFIIALLPFKKNRVLQFSVILKAKPHRQADVMVSAHLIFDTFNGLQLRLFTYVQQQLRAA